MALGAAIELAQVFVDVHRPDASDVLIYVASACLAFLAADRAFAARVPRPPAGPLAGSVWVAAPMQFGLAQRLVAAAAWLAALATAWSLPCAPWVVAGGVVLAALAASRRPAVGLAVLALAPAFDLTRWTGRAYLQEFDALVLAAIGGLLWGLRPPATRRITPVDGLLLGLLAVSYAASAAVGWMKAPPPGADWGNLYDQPLNALRVAKPVLYAAPLWWWLCRTREPWPSILRGLAAGAAVGLTLVVALVVDERQRFCGLLGTTSDFRVTGPFTEMHTGGAYLDAYLVLAAPLLAIGWQSFGSRWARGGIVLLVPGVLYAAMATLSRTPLVVLSVQAGLLAVASAARSRGRWWARLSVPLTSLALASLIGATAAFPALRERFGEASADWNTRVEHWRASLGRLPDDWSTAVFGVGCGGFSRLTRTAPGGTTPGDYRFVNDGKDAYLRLAGGQGLYIDQLTAIQSNATYTIEVRGRRQSGSGGLTVALCEKALLASERMSSQGGLFVDAPLGEWVDVRQPMASGAVGASIDRSPLPRVTRPVVLSLWVEGGAVIDIDQVRLLDADGNDLLVNGDFTQGHDHWWWTSDDHLAWHAKNMWVHLRIEQGWLGVAALLVVASRSLLRLAAGVRRGVPGAAALLCAIGGALAIGTIDSLIDSPRIALLLLILIGLALAYPCAERDLSAEPHGSPAPG